MIEVIHPGLQTQLQDEGRWGWQADGVPVGGAMDVWSHRIANLLVGNADDAATLEILLQGPRLRFACATTIALTGADLSASIDGEPVPTGRALHLAAGAELAFGPRVAGLRAYLAVAGGFDVPPVLGSRSTYARGGLGGLHGRALRAGDRLPLTRATSSPGHATDTARPDPATVQTAAATAVGQAPAPRGAAAEGPEPAATRRWHADPAPAADLLSPLPDPHPRAEIRLLVMPGEQWPDFTPDARAAFLRGPWRIGPQSDRMGYRLEGAALARPSCGELLSEGVAFGTVQVPPDGQPIVLMAERQSTGGYPKIAHVAGVDLPTLAQCAPGQRLCFELLSPDRAQALLEDRARHLARLRALLLTPTTAPAADPAPAPGNHSHTDTGTGPAAPPASPAILPPDASRDRSAAATGDPR